MSKYKRTVGSGTVTIYDSPGLQDGIQDEEVEKQYLKDLKENCGKVDLNLYCVKINDNMQRSEIEAIKNLSDALGKEELWQKTLFVLTFANEIVKPMSYTLDQYFDMQMAEWKALLQYTLTKRVCNSNEAINVQVVPAGNSHVHSPQAAQCDIWLRTLWFQLLGEKGKDEHAVIINHLQKNYRNSLHILVTGRTGAGKSTLVNSIVGKYVAIEGDSISLLGKTKKVSKYERKIPGADSTIYIYDSPGLQDSGNENKHLKDLEESCRGVDFNLYCVRMKDRLQRSEVDTMKKLSDKFGKKEFWQKTLFVLTFANEITLPKRLTLSQYFRKRKVEWETLLQNTLIEKVGIRKEAANVPVVPAGCSNEHSLPATPQYDWLSKLRTQCLDRIPNPILRSITWGQMPQSPESERSD